VSAAEPFLAPSGPAQGQIARAWNYLCRFNPIAQEVMN
jgi:hypothetical protein